jgi:peptide/nickel transport system substrate-binding protein
MSPIRFARIKTRYWFLLGALPVLGLLFLALLPSGERSGPRAQSRVLRIAIPEDVATVDPPFSHFQLSNEVNYNIYDQFFRYAYEDSPAGYRAYDPRKIEGCAVESWKISEDGKEITLKLRRGARFAKTGDPVTADDFIYWFNRARGLKAGTWFNLQLADIESWSKTGDDEVTLHFRKRNPFFFFVFRDQSQAPMEKRMLAEHRDLGDPWSTRWAARNDAGSGAYFIEDWVPGVKLVLRANRHWWSIPPYFDRVILNIVPSSAGRALLFQNGAVDIAEQLSVLEIDNLQRIAGIKIISVPARNQYLFGLNNGMAPFSNRLVRQALSYAVPYDTIVKDVFGGRAVKSRGPVPVRGQFHDGTLWPYTTDLAKARALLAQAGYPEGFRFTLAFAAGDPIALELAVLMQSSLRRIGVSMDLDTETAAVFAERLDKRSFQAWLRDYLLYVDDPGYMGAVLYQSSAPQNWVGYKNLEVDRLFDQINTLWRAEDRTQKTELCREVQKLIIADAPLLYLGEANFNLATRDDIEGYVQQPDNLLWYAPLRRRGESLR